MKPSWSNQIPEGAFKVVIGKHKNCIRLYSNNYYFISDGVCVPETKLENAKELSLNVCDMNKYDLIKDKISNKHYILDIDLDFFRYLIHYLGLHFFHYVYAYSPFSLLFNKTLKKSFFKCLFL